MEIPKAQSFCFRSHTRVHGFRSAYVFDVAQTDGDPLPTLAHDATGDPGIHLAALEQAITDAW